MSLNFQVHDLIHHLSLIDRIGPAAIVKLLRSFDILDDQLHVVLDSSGRASLEMLYQFSVSDLIRQAHCSRAFAERVVSGLADFRALEQEKIACEKRGIRLVTILSEEYPDSLRAIHVPPVMLYLQGERLGNDAKSLAIVGSRAAGSYGKKVIDTFVPDLVKAQWTIVSGGARGIDTFAHQSTLESKGRTIVVLGSGLCSLYPKENSDLFARVSQEGGTLVSAFALHAAPHRGNFPARNRIISGLSDGCLLVQAARKSGARITAQFALEQGKTVLAVPGSIFDELSVGVHDLLAQGARLVQSSDDIFEEFGCSPAAKPLAPGSSEVSLQQAVFSHPLLEHLELPCSLDELASRLGEDIGSLQQQLFELQLQGHVSQNFAGLWSCA